MNVIIRIFKVTIFVVLAVLSHMITVSSTVYASDELHFDLTVSMPGMATREVNGVVALEQPKFQKGFNQSGVHLMLYGTVTGDIISLSGNIKTLFINTPAVFAIDGRLVDDEFSTSFRTRGGTWYDYRCRIVVRRVSS